MASILHVQGTNESEPVGSAHSQFLANYDEHKTHGRPLGYDDLNSKGMTIKLLESNQKLQDLVMTVYHATMHTFADTLAIKVIENQRGKAFIRLLRQPQA